MYPPSTVQKPYSVNSIAIPMDASFMDVDPMVKQLCTTKIKWHYLKNEIFEKKDENLFLFCYSYIWCKMFSFSFAYLKQDSKTPAKSRPIRVAIPLRVCTSAASFIV